MAVADYENSLVMHMCLVGAPQHITPPYYFSGWKGVREFSKGVIFNEIRVNMNLVKRGYDRGGGRWREF